MGSPIGLWGDDSPYGGTSIYGMFSFDPATGSAEQWTVSDESLMAVLNASTAAYDYGTETMWVYTPEINEAGTAFTGNYYLYSFTFSGTEAIGAQGAFVTGLPSDGYFFSIVIDKEGQMYGLGTDGSLYSVDKESGQATAVGSTGIEVADADGRMYGQTAAYDYAGNRIIWNYIPSDGSEVGIATVDKVTAAITKLTDSYYQLSSLASVYYVDPAPMPVEGLALSWKAGQLTASFSAPSTDQNGNALASLAKAELYRLNGNQLELEETLDNPVPGQVCTITHATSESGLQTYAVRVEDAEGNASAYVTAQVTQIEITLPYANGFEADETEAMAALTISDPLGMGGMERTQEAAYEGEWSFKLTSDYNSDGRELILSGIPVEKGTTYEVSFAVASPGATNYDALYLVMDNDYSSAMSTGLSADWIPLMFNFTAAEDRQFTFSFLGLNGDLPIYLDNIGMREIAGPDVPGTLVVNSAMAADEGAMQVVLDMTAPDLSMGGEPLESLGGIIVEYSQSEYFEEFMADTIKSGIQLGEAADYTIDIEGGPGEYYVRARAYNEAGICPNYAYYEEEFWGTTIPLSTGFVGVDEVALPSTVYTAVNGDGTVTIGWRPASGANGGYVGDVSYGLEENGQSVAAADPAYDEASGRFQCTTTVLEPGLHTFVLTAGNGETEDSREIASLGGYEDYAWLHNVDPASTVEPNILFMETEEANSGFAQALYPAPGRPMYIDRLTLFATAPAEGTASERLKIYMGTTSMEYFTGGYLSEPDFVEKDSLTLVYDGEIQFKAGGMPWKSR